MRVFFFIKQYYFTHSIFYAMSVRYICIDIFPKVYSQFLFYAMPVQYYCSDFVIALLRCISAIYLQGDFSWSAFPIALIFGLNTQSTTDKSPVICSINEKKEVIKIKASLLRFI